MDKNELKLFLKSHPIKKFSSAKLEYSLMLDNEFEKNVDKFMLSHNMNSEVEQIKSTIEAASVDELVNLMRKALMGNNRSILINRLLENEFAVMPLIKKKALTNMQDHFIECCVRFMNMCEENPCNWIIENYNQFKSEYLKSMLCLVLGFRGNESVIPFLMSETDRFSKFYPEENFEQGPLLSVSELAYRIYGISE